MALYRCRAAQQSGARMGIDPTAQKLKANQIHSSKRGCPTGARRGARRGQTGAMSFKQNNVLQLVFKMFKITYSCVVYFYYAWYSSELGNEKYGI
jgi:hypothetical protein